MGGTSVVYPHEADEQKTLPADRPYLDISTGSAYFTPLKHRASGIQEVVSLSPTIVWLGLSFIRGFLIATDKCWISIILLDTSLIQPDP